MNETKNQAEPPETPSPFGERSSRRGTSLRIAGLLAVTMFAAAGAWLATREGRDEKPTDSAHANHGSMSAAPAAGQAVTLSAEQARRIGVTYTTATSGLLTTEVRTVAQVAYDERRVQAIAPKIDGWIEALYVNATGQAVRRGDPLFAIYSPMLVAAQQELLVASQLGADLSGASADAQASASELRQAARRRLLHWGVAPADVDRIERTREVQRTLVLRSPASGVVVEKSVLGGQRIMAGDALYRVADLSIVWIEGEVFERDLGLIRKGQGVSVELDALPADVRRGRISYIHPTLNPETRTVRVRVELPNPGLRLKPGMYATIRIRGGGGEATVLVPRTAVLRTGERDLAFVRLAGGMLEPREVTLGSANAEQVQVLRGVRAGESVVTSATFLVDAESNLGTVMGGMGDMPGMDMTAPSAGKSPTFRPDER